jgi:hypothetical protein
VQLLVGGTKATGGLFDDTTPADNDFWTRDKGDVSGVNDQVAQDALIDTQLEQIWDWILRYSLHLENPQGSGNPL